jgi:gluconolactonase
MGSAQLDGVKIFNATGKLRSANVCFGGVKRNRLFMAASHSLYSLYVNTQGAPGG